MQLTLSDDEEIAGDDEFQSALFGQGRLTINAPLDDEQDAPPPVMAQIWGAVQPVLSTDCTLNVQTHRLEIGLQQSAHPPIMLNCQHPSPCHGSILPRPR